MPSLATSKQPVQESPKTSHLLAAQALSWLPNQGSLCLGLALVSESPKSRTQTREIEFEHKTKSRDREPGVVEGQVDGIH